MSTLLLIDDHHVVIDALSYVLRGEGFEVLTAATGQEGIQLAINQKPDVIITDYHMIGMTGLDVLRAIRNHPETADIPVVVLTLEDNDETRRRFFEHGANAFLSKSQHTSELIGAVNHLLYGVP